MFFWCVPFNTRTHHDIRPLNISTLLRFAKSSSGYHFFDSLVCTCIYIYRHAMTVAWNTQKLPRLCVQVCVSEQELWVWCSHLHLHRWPKGSNKFWVPADRGKFPDPGVACRPVSSSWRPFRFQVEKRPKIHPVFLVKMSLEWQVFTTSPASLFFNKCWYTLRSLVFPDSPVASTIFWVWIDVLVRMHGSYLWLCCDWFKRRHLQNVCWLDFPDGKSNATYSTCTYASWSLEFFKQSICNFSNKSISSDKKFISQNFASCKSFCLDITNLCLPVMQQWRHPYFLPRLVPWCL